MKKSILSIAIAILCFSCNQKTKTENPVSTQQKSENIIPEKEKEKYHAPEIGWTFEFMDGWKIEDARIINKDIEEGIKKIEKSGVDPHVTGKEINLFTLRKNTTTKFQATIVPFKESYKGEWNDKYPLIKNHIYNIFASQGMKIDSSSSNETISGIDFEIFNLSIYYNGERAMEQNMYRSYLNGYDFIINMTNNNDAYKQEMLETLRKSKFVTLEK